MRRRERALHNAGFTLIEMVVVIVTLGILAAGFIGFVVALAEGREAVLSRAEQAGAAQVAMSRVREELAFALPGSVRVITEGGSRYFEFVPVAAKGRRRDEADAKEADGLAEGGLEDGARVNFETLGPLEESPGPGGIHSGWVVIAGGASSGQGFYDPAAGGKARLRSVESTPSAAKVRFDPLVLTAGSKSKYFHIARGPVSYACDSKAREIRRYWGYEPARSQPAAELGSLPGVRSAAALKNVLSCGMDYEPPEDGFSHGRAIIKARVLAGGHPVSFHMSVRVPHAP